MARAVSTISTMPGPAGISPLQGTMLVEADLMIVFVVIARDGDHLRVDLVVKGEDSWTPCAGDAPGKRP
jgi:hypothetical protein